MGTGASEIIGGESEAPVGTAALPRTRSTFKGRGGSGVGWTEVGVMGNVVADEGWRRCVGVRQG